MLLLHAPKSSCKQKASISPSFECFGPAVAHHVLR